MSNFLSKLQEQVERYQHLNSIPENNLLGQEASFKVDMDSLPKELLPIAKNLEVLTKAGTTLKNGACFQIRSEKQKGSFYFPTIKLIAFQALVISLGDKHKW
jgi:hypothetical protein